MIHGVTGSKSKFHGSGQTKRQRAWDPKYYNFCALHHLPVIVCTRHKEFYFVDILVGRLDIILREQQTAKWKLMKTKGNYC